jgi:hypothetical protein
MVYDLDDMEEFDVLKLVYRMEGKQNPRFFKRADGKFMTQNCPNGGRRQLQVPSKVSKVAVAAALIGYLLVGSYLVTTNMMAQAQHDCKRAVSARPTKKAVSKFGKLRTQKGESIQCSLDSDKSKVVWAIAMPPPSAHETTAPFSPAPGKHIPTPNMFTSKIN